VVAAARDPQSGLPFSILDKTMGGSVAGLAKVLLITSVFAALLSFHNTVARYVFGMARDRVLPASFAGVGTGSRAGAPFAGSLMQSAIAFAVVAVFLLAGADPFTQLFTWLSSVAAIGVLLLMIGTCIAAIRFFGRDPQKARTAWQATIAPMLGAVVLTVVLVVTVVNLSTLLGVKAGSPLTVLLPALVLVAAVAGALWGMVLRTRRPDIYRSLGMGEEKPLAVLSHSYADIDI
jgi:amino acid transporter